MGNGTFQVDVLSVLFLSLQPLLYLFSNSATNAAFVLRSCCSLIAPALAAPVVAAAAVVVVVAVGASSAPAVSDAD